MVKLVSPVLGVAEADAVKVTLRAVLRKAVLVEHDEDKIRGALEALETAPPYEGSKVARDPGAKQLGGFARKSDTSREAALQNYPRSGSQRSLILDVLVKSPRGCTREEIATYVQLPDNSVRPRVRELIQGGWAEQLRDEDGMSVTRKTALGNRSEVLVPTAKALRRAGIDREAVTA